MKKISSKLTILASLFLITSTAVFAATEDEKSYRYPSDLSDEEHASMMNSANRYDQCLTSQSQELAAQYEDFRKVADVAMENCKPVLTEIDGELEKMNLDPDYRRFFIRSTSQKSARQLLPKLMMMKAK